MDDTTPALHQQPPDSLPDSRLADVLALRRFLLQFRLTAAGPVAWFACPSRSAMVALDAERVGLLRLHRERGLGGIELLAVEGGGA